MPSNMWQGGGPAPGTILNVPLSALHLSPWRPACSIGEVNHAMEGTAEEWFREAMRTGPQQMRAMMTQAPCMAAVLAELVKKAMMHNAVHSRKKTRQNEPVFGGRVLSKT